MTAPFIAFDRTYHRWRRGLAALVLGVGVVALGAARPFRVEVEGESMAPTLLAGDWLVVSRARSVGRGDVVVVRRWDRPELELVKRVVGGPGDEIAGRRLGPDEWFVVGDNAASSTDSRTFGAVRRRDIAGRVRFVYWPPARLGVVRSKAPSRMVAWPSRS